ncbi:MAG: protein-disulfide reductase DsbD domain-containing protein [Planctomycetota bacterium]
MLLAIDSVAAESSNAAVRDGRVEAELISKHTALVPGETALLGLRLTMDEGWHTYWSNPGDSGMATSITWNLPEGFAAHGIDWPAPDYYDVGGLASYAYEGQILLPVRIDVPKDITGDEVTLKATADWLVCKEQCEPGTADLAITLPVASTPADVSVDPANQPLFAWAEARQPQPIIEDRVTALRQGETYTLTVRNVLANPEHAETITARFFPNDPMAIAMGETQHHEFIHDGGVRIMLAANPLSDPPSRLQGVLVLRQGDQLQANEIDVPLRNVAAGS